MKKYSQKDQRWKDTKLGFSEKTTLGSHGCLVTCLACLAEIRPDKVNEILKEVKGFANLNLVVWKKINAIPGLEFEWRGWQYDNDRVKKTIKEYGACIVEVDWDDSLKTSGSHFVLFTGNQQMWDVWNGKIEPTNKYDILKGFAVVKVKENKEGNGLPDNYGEIIHQSTLYEEFKSGGFKDINEVKKEIARLKQKNRDCKGDKKKNYIPKERFKKLEGKFEGLKERNKQEKEEREKREGQYKELLVELAKKLGCENTKPAIFEQVTKLIGCEDSLREKRKDCKELNHKIEKLKKSKKVEKVIKNNSHEHPEFLYKIKLAKRKNG